jgi:pimeloyl-ACP methyl ester carboxylesterase
MGRAPTSSDEYNNYDEFEHLVAHSKALGLPASPPPVRRTEVEVGPDQSLSALVWGEGDPELVLLHGGGQNSHTWDGLALLLGRPLVAFDLPGHGHSSWRADRDYWPWANATAVASGWQQLAPRARHLIGMSLGGMTAMRLASAQPDLVDKVVIVDVTPGVAKRSAGMTPEQRGASALTGEPPVYESFENMAARAIELSPHRSPVAVRRGVLHNAVELPDGSWRWRYDVLHRQGDALPKFGDLWDDVSAMQAPVMLVRGGLSGHVGDDDIEEFVRRQPSARVETVEGAGHAVQSDQTAALARLVDDFLFG